MKKYRDFTYNPDFEWHETEIYLGSEVVKLLIPNYVTDHFSTIHQRLVSIIKWIENHRDLLQKQCLVRLLGFVPTSYKLNEIIIICISLEKEKFFEILLRHIAFKGFIILRFCENFEIIHYQLDT